MTPIAKHNSNPTNKSILASWRQNESLFFFLLHCARVSEQHVIYITYTCTTILPMHVSVTLHDCFAHYRRFDDDAVFLCCVAMVFFFWEGGRRGRRCILMMCCWLHIKKRTQTPANVIDWKVSHLSELRVLCSMRGVCLCLRLQYCECLTMMCFVMWCWFSVLSIYTL